jgi:hypothetical protein
VRVSHHQREPGEVAGYALDDGVDHQKNGHGLVFFFTGLVKFAEKRRQSSICDRHQTGGIDRGSKCASIQTKLNATIFASADF